MYSLYNLKSNNGAFTNSWTNNFHNLRGLFVNYWSMFFFLHSLYAHLYMYKYVFK